MMTEVTLNGVNNIPDPIVRTLRTLIRRVRRIIVLRGLCAVLATAIAAILLVMLVDASVVLFSTWSRWALSAGIYASVAVCAILFLFRPLERSYTLAGVARLIESRHPEMQERISSAVELLTSRDIPELRGSDALIGALAEEAVVDARLVQPRREVTLQAAAPFLAAAALFVAVLGGLLLASPTRMAFLLARATLPFVNLPSVFAGDLSVSPGDIILAQGSSLRITASVSNPAIRNVKFRRVQLDGKETVEDMTFVSAAASNRLSFVMSFPLLNETFRYRVHAGDALSQYYTVRVVPPPIIERVDVYYDYPKYSRLDPLLERDSAGTIRALAGTWVTICAKLNKRVQSAVMQIHGGASAVAVTGEVAQAENGEVTGGFRLKLAPGLAGIWSARFTDEYGLSNARYERAIQAIHDGGPMVRVTHLEQKELRLSPEDRLPVFYTAQDDVGLRAVELMLDVDGKAAAAKALPMPEDSGRAVRTVDGQTEIALSAPEFRNARKITFQLRASDTLPEPLKGPQSAMSELFTILLDSSAPTYAKQVLLSQEERIKRGLQTAKKELTEAKTAAEPWPDALTKNKNIPENVAKQIEQVHKNLAVADTAVRDVAEAVKGGFYGDLADKLQSLADDQIGRAETLSDQIKLADQPEERGALARETKDTIEKSLAQVDDIMKNLDKMTAAIKEAVELNRLAENQASLADEKLEMERETDSGDTNTLARLAAEEKEWQKEQDKVADGLAKMAKEMPGVPQALAAMNREMAQELGKEAAKLAKQQAELGEVTKKGADLHKIEDALKDLAAQQEKLGDEAGNDAGTAEAVDEMKRAAEDIRANRLNEAVAEQGTAWKELSEAANRAAAERAAKPQVARADALAKRQEDLRKKTEDLAAQRQAATEPLRERALKRLGEEQEELAREAARLARNVEEAAPQEDRIQEQAAQSAKAAARELQQRRMREARRAAESAGSDLEKLARRLEDAAAEQVGEQGEEEEGGEEAEGEPENGEEQAQEPHQGQGQPENAEKPHKGKGGKHRQKPRVSELAETAGELAEQQERLTQEMEALGNDDMGAELAGEQESVAERAAELADSANAMREEANQMESPHRGQTQQGAEQMNAARRNAEQAARQMNSPQSQQAVQSQQAAAQALQQAAQTMESLAKALAQTPAPPSDQQGTEPGQLAEAYQKAREAAESQEGVDAVQSAEALAGAAEQASARAQAMGANPKPMNPQNLAMDGRGANVQDAGRPETIPWMKRLGLRLRDWLRLPGELRDEILQAAVSEGPEEYRPLIKRYFQELARRGGQ